MTHDYVTRFDRKWAFSFVMVPTTYEDGATWKIPLLYSYTEPGLHQPEKQDLDPHQTTPELL